MPKGPTKEQIEQYRKAKEEQRKAGYGKKNKSGYGRSTTDAIQRGFMGKSDAEQASDRSKKSSWFEDGGVAKKKMKKLAEKKMCPSCSKGKCSCK